MPCCAYLGNLEKALGDVDDTTEVLNALNALLHGIGVVLAGGIEDVLDLVGLVVGPLLVSGATVDGDTGVDGKQTQHDDGLLVDDVELVADGGDRDGGAGRQDGGLAQQAAAGQGVQDALGLLLGGGGVALLAGLQGGDHGGLLHGEGGGGTRAGGAC